MLRFGSTSSTADNPHPPGTQEHLDWLSDWIDAFFEHGRQWAEVRRIVASQRHRRR